MAKYGDQGHAIIDDIINAFRQKSNNLDTNKRSLRDMTIRSTNRRGRETSSEAPLPYGGLPPSAANTPGFVVGQPVDPSTWASKEIQPSEILSDDSNSRDSALTSMRDQYAPGADIWSTDEGKAILEAAKTNSYGGKDQGTLAEFNTQQRQAGIGANDEIIEALGYEGNMAEWAKANPALAMREYNKKFGNSYGGFGSGDANTVLPNGMTAGEDARQAAMNAAAIMEGTGRPRESNTAQMAPAQNVPTQAQNNNDLNVEAVNEYMRPDLGGRRLLEYTKSLRGRN